MSGKIQAITLQPKPSRKLRLWLVTTHLLTLLVILFAPLITWHKSILLFVLSLHAVFSYRRTRKGSGARIQAARIRPDGRSRIT
ncbi:MAG: hypothetical protein AB2637_14690, partial [Candidatus Thiodiazotropha sp.]